jgi:mono/diheme cytochrome c family protein
VGLKPHRYAGLSRRYAKAGRSASLFALCALTMLGAACRQDMHNAPRVKPYGETDAFADGRGMRPLPDGTVARGHLNDDELLYTGKINGQPADEFPFPVTRQVLERGRDRFNIYCSPCHGRTAMGNGMVVQRGLRPPPSFHDDKIRTQPVGYYFDVMTNGFGAMQDYRMQLEPKDRWAVASYIRALQYSQRASVTDVPADKRGELDKPPDQEPKPAPAHGEH